VIIFVGDKPSNKNKCPSIPFVGTQSYKRLLEWIWIMDIDISQVRLCNKDFIHGTYEDWYIPLGNEAEKAVKERLFFVWNWKKQKEEIIEPYYFKLPHPSGLNRKLNDKKWLNQQLKECKEWLQR
jgi:uracil-DNA glycosylase